MLYMEERDVESVTPIEETDWENDSKCMSANVDMSAACDNSADKELAVVYENEPDKTFYTILCEECASDYLRKWDIAQIYGDSAIEDDSDYKIN